ncbi:MAG TPA: hypothetical protein VNB54_12345, partial [Alphaproteobacteria bacterium]|nr:hypothetical protein [Alphaproteobacteria bacterium]
VAPGSNPVPFTVSVNGTYVPPKTSNAEVGEIELMEGGGGGVGVGCSCAAGGEPPQPKIATQTHARTKANNQDRLI